MTETVCLRIESNAKKGMSKVCDELGISMSTVFNMFAKTIAREKKIPLSLDLNEIYNDNIRESIKNVKQKRNLSKYFNSVDDLLEDLNA